MKNENLKLYAIYKDEQHKGNERAINENKAIKKYIIHAGFKIFITDLKFFARYKAILAVDGVHYNSIKAF